MAHRGDVARCHCGASVELHNDRVPWHKVPGARTNCQYAGLSAAGWDAIGRVQRVGDLVLSCRACGDRHQVKNAPDGSAKPLVCGACGRLGSIEDFLARSLGVVPKAQAGRVHRYAG